MNYIIMSALARNFIQSEHYIFSHYRSLNKFPFFGSKKYIMLTIIFQLYLNSTFKNLI